jgi:DNA repair exonuclease SbcCD ATPase subunit
VGEAARVTSIPILADLRAALVTFTAEARDALGAAEMEIRRTFEWLDEQLKYWVHEVRRAEDAVFEAQQELARRKLMRVGDRPPDCTEQEKALRKARARLEHAQQQRDKTRTWLRELPTAVNEYEGPARRLGNLVEADLRRACALLERKLEALEAYVGLTAPPKEKQP